MAYDLSQCSQGRPEPDPIEPMRHGSENGALLGDMLIAGSEQLRYDLSHSVSHRRPNDQRATNALA